MNIINGYNIDRKRLLPDRIKHSPTSFDCERTTNRYVNSSEYIRLEIATDELCA